MKRDLTIELGTFSAVLFIVLMIVVIAGIMGMGEKIGVTHIISAVGLMLSLVLKTGFEVLEKQNRVLIDQNKFLIKK